MCERIGARYVCTLECSYLFIIVVFFVTQFLHTNETELECILNQIYRPTSSLMFCTVVLKTLCKSFTSSCGLVLILPPTHLSIYGPLGISHKHRNREVSKLTKSNKNYDPISVIETNRVRNGRT